MPTTYVSTKAADGVQPRLSNHDDTVYCEFDIAADVGAAADGGGGAGGTAFALDDVVQMVKVQAGTKIMDVLLSVDALDSSTGIVTAVGDEDDEDRFITGAQIGRSGAAGVQALNNHTGHLHEYTADDTIDFKVTTAATGTASTSGKVRLSVKLTPQQ